MTPKKSTGIGSYQTQKAFLAQYSILKALSDGRWHRNMELKKETKLSSRTLAKHLKKLESLKLIDRHEDDESGKYPIPVLYQATTDLIEFARTIRFVEETRNLIESALMESKDPLWLLEGIHAYSQVSFIQILNELKEKRNMSKDELEYIEQLYLQTPYTFLMNSLIKASRKIIDEIDFDKLLVSQVKRQKIIAEMQLKFFSEFDVDKQS